MKKRIFAILLVFMGILALVSCTDSKKTYKITYVLNDGINDAANPNEYVQGEVTKLNPATKEGYIFIGWYLDDHQIVEISASQSGDITIEARFREKFSDKTPVTDSLKLTADYKDKDYYEDGIGVATVVQYVDGDTTIFRTKNGHKVTIRYEGIDTPESTYTVEPWGFGAANHTKDVLKNAKEIVLQTDNGTPGKDNPDNSGVRFLAWVWADGRLLNLELVELAYANSKASGTTLKKYFDEALLIPVSSKARIYGEKDPNYDYSTVYTPMTLKELHEKYGTEEAINKELDKGKKVMVSGTVVRKHGISSAYLQQILFDEETDQEEIYGIYLYGGFTPNQRLNVGYTVIVSGTISYYNGSLQITDVSPSNVKIQTMLDQDKVKTIEVDDIHTYLQDEMTIGNLIKVDTPITITKVYDAEDTDAFSLTGSYTNKEGKTQTVSIRIDKNVNLTDPNGNRITTGDYFVGKTFTSLTAIVGYFDPTQNSVHDGYIQLMLVASNDYTLAE